jgi:hypothetical protein
VGVLRHEARGSQLDELGPWDLWIEGPVEVGQVSDLDDAGGFEAACEQAVGAPGELVFDEQLKELRVSQRGALSLLEAHGQGFCHAGQSKMAQTDGERMIHRKSSMR